MRGFELITVIDFPFLRTLPGLAWRLRVVNVVIERQQTVFLWLVRRRYVL